MGVQPGEWVDCASGPLEGRSGWSMWIGCLAQTADREVLLEVTHLSPGCLLQLCSNKAINITGSGFNSVFTVTVAES